MSQDLTSENDGQGGGRDRAEGVPQEGGPLRARFVLPAGRRGGGFLRIAYRVSENEWKYEAVSFQPALVGLLLVLRSAYRSDAQDPESEPMRGWRHPGVLARMIGEENGWEPDAHAVRANMVRVNKLIGDAASRVREKHREADFPQRVDPAAAGFRRPAGFRLQCRRPHQEGTRRPWRGGGVTRQRGCWSAGV